MANLCKPIHDIMNYSTSICPFESGKCGKEGKKLQKFEYLVNENSFLDEIKNFFIVFEGLLFGEKIKICWKIADRSFKNFTVFSAMQWVLSWWKYQALDIRSGKYIDSMTPLTRKKVKPINNSALRDHLLHCNYLPSCDIVSILGHENKKFLSEVKESLLIMKDKTSLKESLVLHLCSNLIKYPKDFWFISW